MGDVGPDALLPEGAQELAQQKRVARCHPVAGLDEGVRTLPQELVDQRRCGLGRQRGGVQRPREALGAQRFQQRDLAVGLVGSRGD